MKKLAAALFILLGLAIKPSAEAAFGFNAGFGLPYVSQFGLNYLHSSNRFSVDVNHGSFNLDVDIVALSLTKTELVVKWHPFAGSFYLGAGIGSQALSSKATQTVLTEEVEAEIKITSSTLTPVLGWMWGASNGGFFAGMEFGMQTHQSPKTTLTTNADASIQTNAEYMELEADIREQGEKYGEASVTVMTLLKIGYLF